MRSGFHEIDSADMLQTAFAGLSTSECHTLPVLHRGQLVGILTMENVGEFIAVQAALKGTEADVTTQPTLARIEQPTLVPLTRSLKKSTDFVNESLTHDTLFGCVGTDMHELHT